MNEPKSPPFPSLGVWRTMTEAERKALVDRYSREMRDYGERCLQYLNGFYSAERTT